MNELRIRIDKSEIWRNANLKSIFNSEKFFKIIFQASCIIIYRPSLHRSVICDLCESSERRTHPKLSVDKLQASPFVRPSLVRLPVAL